VPTPIPPGWAPLIGAYTRSLAAMGRPDTTIATRRSHMARLSRSLVIERPADVTAEVLRDWFAAQVWARETRRSYRNSCVSFFRWAHHEGLLTTNPAADMPPVTPDRPKPKPTPDRVWRAAKMAADPRVGLMLRLAAEAGLRRAEVAQVHTDDLRDSAGGPQLLVHGKGARERVIPITDELAEAIEAGPAGHTLGAPSQGWLFPGDIGGHLSPRRVGELCADVMPGVWTMHSLRHRAGTKAHEGTMDLRAVQMFLGHSSLSVTERYVATSDKAIRAAMMAAAQAS
jgi:integrase